MANEVVKKIQESFLTKISESTILDQRVKSKISSLFNDEVKISKQDVGDALEVLMQIEEVNDENSETDS